MLIVSVVALKRESGARQDLATAHRDKDTLQAALGGLRAENLEAKSKLEQLEAELKRFRAQKDGGSTELKRAHDEIARLQREVAQAALVAPPQESQERSGASEIGGLELQLVRRLAEELNKENITAEIDRGTGALDLREELILALGRRELPQDQEQTAGRIGHAVVRVLEDPALARNIARIEVIGHADRAGSAELNLALSQKRATTLVDLWRRELAGRPDPRCILAKIFPVGISNFRPRVLDESNDRTCGDDPDDPSTIEQENRGCRKNRRIEIRVVPKEASREEVAGCP